MRLQLTLGPRVDFPEPHHRACQADDNEPVGQAQRHHIEELVEEGQFDDGHLPQKHDKGDGDEPVASLEVQAAPTRFVPTGIEQIPEVGHHEDGEEQRLLIGSDVALAAQVRREQVGKLAGVGMLEDEE